MNPAARRSLYSLALLLTILGAHPATASDAIAPRLRVLAAASLTDVVEALAPAFEGARLETAFAGSSALARQIRDGAPADVFLSASPEWVDFLRDENALAGEPIVLARNRLVCIVPAESPLADATDAASLAARIGPKGRIAIADPGVPAGEYARAALRTLGLLEGLERRLVGQQDVRGVLHAVERGELDAGFVYATDAAIASVAIAFAFDPSTHPPIEYLAVALRGATNRAGAARFLDFLASDAARRILVDAGFATP